MKHLASILTLACTSALAAPTLSNEAFTQLTRGDETATSTAYGYLLGVIEAVEGSRICLPPGVTVWDLAKEASSVPELASPGAPAARTIIHFLAKRYPC